jgi:hypothetical protein
MNQTPVPASQSRTFSAKVFGGGTTACVFAVFFLFGTARFLAAFFGFLFGADTFFAGFVGALFLLFFGFFDAAVRELGFFPFFAFFFWVTIIRTGSLADRCLNDNREPWATVGGDVPPPPPSPRPRRSGRRPTWGLGVEAAPARPLFRGATT